MADPGRGFPAGKKDPALAIYRCALSHLLEILEEPMTLEEIAGRLGIVKAQMKEWLERAEVEKRIEKTKRPVRYRRARVQGLL